MLIPSGPAGRTTDAKPAAAVLLLGALLVGWFAAPSDSVDDSVHTAVNHLVRYWAYHPELSFPHECDHLTDLDMMEEHAAQARRAIAGRSSANPVPPGTQDGLDALCHDALRAQSQRGWRRYAVTSGDGPGLNWLTYAAMHESLLLIILHCALLYFMCVPWLEEAWGVPVTLGFFLLVTLFGAAVHALFAGDGAQLHGASTLLAGGVGAYVARAFNEPFVYEVRAGKKWAVDAPVWTLLAYWLFKEVAFALLDYPDQRFWIDVPCLFFGAGVSAYLKVSGLDRKLAGGDDDEVTAPAPAVEGEPPQPADGPTAALTAAPGAETLHAPLGFVQPSAGVSTLWGWDPPRKGTQQPDALIARWSSDENLRATRIDQRDMPKVGDNGPAEEGPDDALGAAKTPENGAESGADTVIDTSLDSMLAVLAPRPDNANPVERDPIPEKDGGDVQDVLPTQVFDKPPAELLRRTGSADELAAVAQSVKQQLNAEAAAPPAKPSTIPPEAEERVVLPSKVAPGTRPSSEVLAALDALVDEADYPQMPTDEGGRRTGAFTKPLAESPGPTPLPADPPATKSKPQTGPMTLQLSAATDPRWPASVMAEPLHCRVVGRDRKTWHLVTAEGDDVAMPVADVRAVAVGMVQLYRPPRGKSRNALVTDVVAQHGQHVGARYRIPVDAFDFDRLMPGTDRRTAWRRLVQELVEASGAITLPDDASFPGPPFDGHRDESAFEGAYLPVG